MARSARERELDLRVVSATYWTVASVARAFGEILDAQEGVAHAGEAETSMMLALEPALVDREEMARVDGGTPTRAPPEASTAGAAWTR